MLRITLMQRADCLSYVFFRRHGPGAICIVMGDICLTHCGFVFVRDGQNSILQLLFMRA